MSKTEEWEPNRNELAATIELLQTHQYLFETPAEFRTSELPEEWHTGEKQELLAKLQDLGVIRKIGKDHLGKGTYRVRYRWNRQRRNQLQAYVDSENKFSDYVDGCDCKTHIKNSRSGEYVCRFCGHTYTREQIKQIEL